MERKRVLQLLSLGALAGGLAAALPLAQRWPKEQTVHYVLGDEAARVTELDARWAAAAPTGAGRTPAGSSPAEAPAADDLREATFRYGTGEAPRVVTHTPRLPDGEYTVQIDLASAGERVAVTRAITLAGGSTSIDLSRVLGGGARGAQGAR